MGRPRLVVPDKVLEYLIEQGETHEEIARMSSVWSGQPVDRSSVSHAARKLGLCRRPHLPAKVAQQAYTWKVQPQHVQSAALRWLRAIAREAAGLPVTEWDQTRTRNWKAKLDRGGLITCYDPEIGIWYDKRKPGEKGYWRA